MNDNLCTQDAIRDIYDRLFRAAGMAIADGWR